MRAEGGVLALFDGLAEVADEAQRARVRDAVAAFARRYNHPRNRYLVTCRVYAYYQQDDRDNYPFQLPEVFRVFTLAPFVEERINAFVDVWYDQVQALGWKTPAEASDLAGGLKQAVRRRGLDVLAPRPLLLTVMALLHTTRGRLPDDRVELYDETVELLLARWQEARLGVESGVRSQVNLKLLKAALECATYEAHVAQHAAEGTADIPEKDLRQVLANECLNGDWGGTGALIDYIRTRAGLLIERGPGLYSFPHRTFQEYLAAAYLCRQPGFSHSVARLLRANPAQWREVFLMSMGILSRLKRMAYVAMFAAKELCPQADAPKDDYPAVPDDDWRAAWYAGEALLEIGLAEARKADAGTVERVSGWLVALLQAGALSPVERAAAGDVLAELGDQRPGVRLRADSLPDIAWCDVPAGTFLMGSADGDRMASDREKPQHEVSLPAFRVARYPVTNAQYAAFVRDGGYTDRWRACWTDADWADKGARTGPRRFGGTYDLPNHPVVMVTWYEALAFCRWLTARLRAAGALKPNDKVTLPSEAQWEKAARGPSTGSEGARIYPWGDEADADKANYDQAGIDTTSAVGCFPAGASPCGALDMAGNAWEWCSTKWEENYDDYRGDNSPEGKDLRVLRGGAFFLGSRFVRCAYRFRDPPDYRSRNVGFRVVVAPGSPSGR